MSYNKFIAYGKTFELYEYEKIPNAVYYKGFKRPRNVRQGAFGSKDLSLNGGSMESEQGQKRSDNAKRSRLAFVRLVKANIDGTEKPLLFTLTYRENETSIATAYKHFGLFTKALRYKFGSSFKFVAVPEFQRRGAVHFHALFWGLPYEAFLCEKSTRFFFKAWGFGFVFIKETDGNEKLGHYLAKYMAKAFVDKRLYQKKAYVSSRNILRPVVGSGFSPIWYVVEDWVGVDIPPLKKKEFMTKWLGKGRLSIYKINK